MYRSGGWLGPATSKHMETSVEFMSYFGLDVHKRTISYCVRQSDGTIVQEGSVPALRESLDELVAQVPPPCFIGLEATLFTAWVYDHLLSKGICVRVAHPAMLKAIFAGERKNDEIDARKLGSSQMQLFSRMPPV